MPTSTALPTSHHFHPSLSPVVSLSLGILHERMRMQMLAKPSSNLLRKLEAATQAAAQNLDEEHLSSWLLRLEIWRKIGFSRDWCLCIVLCTRSGACYYYFGGIFWPTVKYGEYPGIHQCSCSLPVPPPQNSHPHTQTTLVAASVAVGCIIARRCRLITVINNKVIHYLLWQKLAKFCPVHKYYSKNQHKNLLQKVDTHDKYIQQRSGL